MLVFVPWGGGSVLFLAQFLWILSAGLTSLPLCSDLLLPCSFIATDGKDKIKAMLPTNFASEVHSGNLKNLGLIRILDYTCNLVKGNNDK